MDFGTAELAEEATQKWNSEFIGTGVLQSKLTQINMKLAPSKTNYPSGSNPTVEKPQVVCSDSGETTEECRSSEMTSKPHRNKIKQNSRLWIMTFNVNSLLKVGKLKNILDKARDRNIKIIAFQESRYMDEHPFESEGYRIYKGKPGERSMTNCPQFGTGFIINKSILDSVSSFNSYSGRISTITMRSMNRIYTLINCHAPTNITNKEEPEKVEEFWNKLDNIMQRIPQNHVKILMGDFNAQIGKEKNFRYWVGKWPGHKQTNHNGRRLIELCRSHDLFFKSTFFKKKPSKTKTWSCPNALLGEFQLDHVMISRVNTTEIMKLKVLRGLDLDSDHYPTKFSLDIIPEKRNFKLKAPQRKYDLQNIKGNIQFTKQTEQLKPQNWKELQIGLVQTAEKVAPRNKTRKHAWWSDECDRLIQLRQQAWQNWSSNRCENTLQDLKDVRKTVTKSIRKIRKQSEEAKLQEIEEHFKKNNSRNFYRTFKHKITKYSPPTLQFKYENGELAHSNSKNCEILASYFSKLLNCEKPKETFSFNPNQRNTDSKPPSVQEIREIIQSLKNNKASGEDQITAELWKNAGENFIIKLKDILEEIWQTEKIPPEWKTAIIHPLHKKGSKTDPNNYRGISLLSVTYKILSKALHNRAELQLDPQLDEYQGGFRKGRSCAEQIINLKNSMKYFHNTSTKKFVITFVDFKKAYDSIDRESLFRTLAEFGLDKKTTNIIRETLTDTISKVKFMGEQSKGFKIDTGVRQGDGLSPLLFNCALEKVVREWRKAGAPTHRLGPKFKGVNLDCLAFADDMALIAKDIPDAQKQLEILHEQAAKIGLQISFEKTKFMTDIKTAPRELKIGNNKVFRVKEFKYLGEWITENCNETKSIKTRIQRMETAFQLTKSIYNKKCLSWNCKIRHYQTVIKPEALYASETLNLQHENLKHQLEIKERKIMRKILGPKIKNDINYPKPNEEIYKQISKITDSMRMRRIQFMGHLERMNANRLTNQIHIFLKSKATRPNWYRQTEKDLRELGYPNLHDRDIIRKITKSRGFEVEKKVKTVIWSEQRKQTHSLRMKEYWAKKKAKSVDSAWS